MTAMLDLHHDVLYLKVVEFKSEEWQEVQETQFSTWVEHEMIATPVQHSYQNNNYTNL